MNPIPVDVEPDSWISVWGPSVVGTVIGAVLSGLILWLLYRVTEKRADRRIHREIDANAQMAAFERDRREARERDERRLSAVGAFVAAMTMAAMQLEQDVRSGAATSQYLNRLRMEVSISISRLGVAFLLDEPDFGKYLAATGRRCLNADLEGAAFEVFCDDLEGVTNFVLIWAHNPRADREWPQFFVS